MRATSAAVGGLQSSDTIETWLEAAQLTAGAALDTAFCNGVTLPPQGLCIPVGYLVPRGAQCRALGAD